MKSLFYLSFKSLLNRKSSVGLSIVSIAISVSLFLFIQKTQRASREAFLTTVSNVDLLIGAKGGEIQLLLYSIFHIGRATNNFSYKSFLNLSQRRDVAWTIPISLGDSHRGFRVIGTNESYFQHYQFGKAQNLNFFSGRPFSNIFEVVLGGNVARKLKYKLNHTITLSHGVSENTLMEHRDRPFKIVGILDQTYTPVDDSVYVSLESIEAIHYDWSDGIAPDPTNMTPLHSLKGDALKPQSLTAALVGLSNKFGIFRLKKEIETGEEEALMATLPGATFQQIWQSVSLLEKALKAAAIFILISGLLGLLASLLSTLNERRRELAILRAVGAGPKDIFLMLSLDAATVSLSGVCLGIVLANILFPIILPLLSSQLGLALHGNQFDAKELLLIPIVVGAGLCVGAIPAWRAYRNTLADGLNIKV